MYPLDMKRLPPPFFAAALLILAASLCSCQMAKPRESPLPPPDPQPVLARVAGTVEEFRTTPGSWVQAGEWVATLQPPAPLADPAELREALRQREAELVRARDTYLREKQRIESGQTFEAGLPSAQQAFDAAQIGRNAALAELESTQQKVEQLRHYAPCAGRVVRLAASTGDTVRAGTPLLFIQAAP